MTHSSTSHFERKIERAAVVISLPEGMDDRVIGHIGLVTHFNYHNRPNLCRIEMSCGSVLNLDASRLMDVDMYEPDTRDELIIELLNRSK